MYVEWGEVAIILVKTAQPVLMVKTAEAHQKDGIAMLGTATRAERAARGRHCIWRES